MKSKHALPSAASVLHGRAALRLVRCHDHHLDLCGVGRQDRCVPPADGRMQDAWGSGQECCGIVSRFSCEEMSERGAIQLVDPESACQNGQCENTMLMLGDDLDGCKPNDSLQLEVCAQPRLYLLRELGTCELLNCTPVEYFAPAGCGDTHCHCGGLAASRVIR